MHYFIGGLIGLPIGALAVSIFEYKLHYNLIDYILGFFYKTEASIKKDINKL